jgi:hypothetical protein
MCAILSQEETYLDLRRFLTTQDQHLSVLFEPMRPHLDVTYPARQVADLECMTQDLFTAYALVADEIRAAVGKEPLAGFGPLRLFSLAALEAMLPWDEHLCGQVSVRRVHDEARDVFGHREGGSLDG